MTDLELVTDLEMSRKLKEAGFPQGDSFFVWVVYSWHDDTLEDISRNRVVDRDTYREKYLKNNGAIELYDGFAAPTLSEILAELPEDIHDHDYNIVMTRGKNGYEFNYHTVGDDVCFDWLSPAALYCRLVEDGLIKKEKP